MLLYDWEESFIALWQLGEMRGLQIGFYRGLADGYMDGRIGDCSREWTAMVEGLKDNLCYYEEA